MQENSNNSTESKKNFWFFVVFGILLLASVAISFLRYYVFKDYQIVAQVSCNPNTEVCFQAECDPATEEQCDLTADFEFVSYYKYISKNASNIYACEASQQKLGCNKELSCLKNEEKCSYEYCSEDLLQEGEICAEPNN